MVKKIQTRIFVLVTLMALSAPSGFAGTRGERIDEGSDLHRQIRKRLVTIPFYSVFDNLEFSVDTGEGDTVTLYGQVLRPAIRKDAERRVARIKGVNRVINKIEVLPPSVFDDSIRRRTYLAVFRTGSLYRYALGASTSIHIVVDSGHSTLVGVVRNETDKRLALLQARGVAGVFSVTDRLRVERNRY